MNTGVAVADVHSDDLRAEYRTAFGNWASQVDGLQALIVSQATNAVVKAAEDRVNAAEVAYRTSRDRLMDDMNPVPR